MMNNEKKIIKINEMMKQMIKKMIMLRLTIKRCKTGFLFGIYNLVKKKNKPIKFRKPFKVERAEEIVKPKAKPALVKSDRKYSKKNKVKIKEKNQYQLKKLREKKL